MDLWKCFNHIYLLGAINRPLYRSGVGLKQRRSTSIGIFSRNRSSSGMHLMGGLGRRMSRP